MNNLLTTLWSPLERKAAVMSRLTGDWWLLFQPWMMKRVPAAPEFHCDPLIEPVVWASLWPAVGFLRVNRTKKTSAAALKAGSGVSGSNGSKSIKCILPSPSGINDQRWSPTGRAIAAVYQVNLELSRTNLCFNQIFTSCEQQNTQNQASLHCQASVFTIEQLKRLW